MKHTPGPWFVVPPPWDRDGTGVATGQDPHGARIICNTGLWDREEEDVDEGHAEDIANAHLIAAAPDLLDVAKEILAYSPDHFPMLFKKAGAAVAKATVRSR